MSAAKKGFYYKRLKAAGIPLEKTFAQYKEAELIEAHQLAEDNGLVEKPTMAELAEVEARAHAPRPRQTEDDEPPATPEPKPAEASAPSPQPRRNPDEMAGVRQNTKKPEDVIRVDEQGRKWLQEEVRKPAYPKPRGRRVLRYNDPGVQRKQVTAGDYTEEFEVAGDPANARPSEIKITLPSYQVGKYRDPRMPFVVLTYNGNTGFDRIEVETYFGGVELVPATCKRKYVENVLCYDIRSVVQTINEEYRRLQLTGQIQ